MRDINNASQVPVSALTMCVLYAQALCQFPTTVNPASLWWVARVGPGQGSAVLKASVEPAGKAQELIGPAPSALTTRGQGTGGRATRIVRRSVLGEATRT